MINQLFHKYGTYKQFNQNLVGGLIHKDAICFIEETRQIYAQGKLYAVSLKDFQKYEEVIQTHQKKLENIQERLVAFSKEIDDFVGDVNNKLDAYKKNIDTVDNLYNSMSTKYNELNLSFAELNEAVFVYKGIVDNLRKQHETFETNTNQNLNNQGTRLTSIERAIEAIDVRFQQITDKYTEVMTYIQEVQAAEIETRQKVNALELSKGEANGLATLNESGHVPSYQLPAYVDDILEFSSKEFFPEEGVSGKLYLDKFENKTYRWTGTQYTEISNSLALGETSSTAYPGNRGKMISDYLTAHMADNNNPHNVNKQQLGLENVDNTSDVDKPMSTVTKAAVDEINESMEIMANMLEERLDHLTRNLDAINEKHDDLDLSILNFDENVKNLNEIIQDIDERLDRLGKNLDNLKTIIDEGDIVTVDTKLSNISENPVQNKVVSKALDDLKNNGTALSKNIVSVSVENNPTFDWTVNNQVFLETMGGNCILKMKSPLILTNEGSGAFCRLIFYTNSNSYFVNVDASNTMLPNSGQSEIGFAFTGLSSGGMYMADIFIGRVNPFNDDEDIVINHATCNQLV